MMPRWGIVGTGDISSRVVTDLLAIEPRSISAVWGRTQERADAFANEHSAPFATADRAALFSRDDVDIVYIATPAHTHRDIALEALDAGKHVLVEKPMATSADDVVTLFDRATRAGRFIMEAMWMRFNPLHLEVRDRVLGGDLGEVRGVRASFGTPFHPRGNILRPEDGGSILLDRGIYPVTLAHWFLGEPERVRASGELRGDVDVAGHATVDYADGRFAQLAWSGVEFLDLSAAVSGEKGWITIDPMFWAGSTARVHAGGAEQIFVSPELLRHPRQGNGYGPMLQAVSDAVAAGRLQHPWHDAQATTAVARTLDHIAAQIVSDKSIKEEANR